ncbi:MAG: hypothetical protein IKL84_02820 [Clostridia bacterium]|nr:hypothetical protein [Clostridia bacterium]
MDSFKISAVAFLCTVVAVLVKQYRAEFVLPVRTAASIVLLGFGSALMVPVLRWIRALDCFAAEEIALLMRALCIVLLVHICAAICRDCGEASVASCLEFAGRAELLLLALPLLDRILSVVSVLLTW